MTIAWSVAWNSNIAPSCSGEKIIAEPAKLSAGPAGGLVGCKKFEDGRGGGLISRNICKRCTLRVLISSRHALCAQGAATLQSCWAYAYTYLITVTICSTVDKILNGSLLGGPAGWYFPWHVNEMGNLLGCHLLSKVCESEWLTPEPQAEQQRCWHLHAAFSAVIFLRKIASAPIQHSAHWCFWGM